MASHIGRPHAFAFLLVFALYFAVNDVQFVDKVYHEVRVDGIAPRVGTLSCSKRTADVALLLQDVVELNANGCCLVFEEGLGNLSVPNQFVRVHGCIGIAAA